ncbi:MAG: MogA/MoaB family molybdenum cofactor biosynthesis protein [Dehalococcoidia bacterium]|nr:MogA/MoaB family molybdenum cofactor biosynthesis protein [Dehalococcoidia bacterium]MYD50371.1 MogA/MoaB family molybdenum cofactor biosynthesis protein [Dehalococcoidia bacterium]
MTTSEHSFSFAVLTSSDAGAKGEREDTSGDAVVEMMTAAGFKLIHRDIVPDEADRIAERLTAWSDGGDVDVIVTTGGTGLGPRDVTPQATASVVEFQVPGIAEAMRTETTRITPMAMLSRSVVGVRNGCLIVNLPGSPKGVRETLDVALKALTHGLEMLQGWRGHPSH